MDQLNMRKKSLYEYRVVIFDLDGTLYYQRPFRLRMLRHLAGYVMAHPLRFRDLLIIKTYRSVRERWEDCERECEKDPGYAKLGLDDRQYRYVADRMKTDPARVKRATDHFMLEMPLRFLASYRDEILAGAVDRLREKNITVVIYSDYPVENKLRALGIRADACYTSADARIGSMKPDPKGIAVILEDLGCPASEALMIGDRYEKDGLAAAGCQVDYISVGKSRKKRADIHAHIRA